MSALRSSLTPIALCIVFASIGCEGDDAGDNGGAGGIGSADPGNRAGSGGSSSGGGDAGDDGPAAGGAGSGSPGALDEGALGSDLSAAQVEDLCATLDAAAALVGDLELSCQGEAWLATFDQSECEQIVVLCNDAGATMLGLEEPSTCASMGQELPDCDVTVGEMIACAEEYGRFWTSRTCAMEGLTDEGPSCDVAFQERCPSLYGPPDGGGNSGGAGSGGGSGTGRCSGIGPSCFSQFSSGTCIGVDGCIWSSSTDSCSGVSRSCSSYFDAIGCGSQTGCFWSP
jgi:hypothetical protein